ncbi:MAG: DUF1501 domain-containing protein [Planctomycetales bacterium]
MNHSPHPPHGRFLPVGRRSILQAGALSLLGGWPVRRSASAAPTVPQGTSAPRAKSIVLVFLTGAASHHDTFDMKPEAPAEIRGEFQPIATSTPGVAICEHLPQLAARAHHYALVRTLSHRDNNHLMSTHHVLTGNLQPGGFFDKIASRDDWPSYASALAFLQPRRDGLPSGINLPTYLMEGPLTWPGQHAGFLGAPFDPWQVTGDPAKPDFRVDSLTLAPGIDVGRLDKRQSLLEEINRQQQRIEQVAQTQRLSSDQQAVFSILTSSKLAQAFELGREPDAVRDRYGRHTTGQSLLVARRLVEAGVPVIQVNIGRVQNWDNHGKIFPTLKKRLLPPLDQGVSALLDDLANSGRLEDTLVLMLGEFGRTPKINGEAGRDHWGPCFFGVFAGAGVRGGQVIGRSDEIGAYPVTTAYSPNDVGATVYSLLGIPAEVEVHDRLNRPVRLNTGTAIEPLFTGAAS